MLGAGLLVAAVGVESVALSHYSAHAVPRDFGSVASSAATPPGPTSTSSLPAPGIVPVQDAGSPAAPVRITIPSLHVSAPLMKVELDAVSSLVVPQDPHVVGWWQASALAGSQIGTTVLDGHVDTAEQGPGTLFHLQDLPAGATIVLRAANGHYYTYRVTTRRVLKKSTGLSARLFSPTAPGTLAVVTCGGPFDRATHHYLDNIVVLARPVAG
ncbi:class F sortase [Allobranchiibius sp. CTAmp26]|uniref:class F sortase n=1 Tax=Allobranchiibius sp. CTAmp26 TaxID=2815214 RepID=UPI001AA0BE74|nr:class F sortase [Allobranchiibius sp. CTAmp26]MBO1756484.1 class F sortase [Allobranchiibius sp. CTAmp26]